MYGLTLSFPIMQAWNFVIIFKKYVFLFLLHWSQLTEEFSVQYEFRLVDEMQRYEIIVCWSHEGEEFSRADFIGKYVLSRFKIAYKVTSWKLKVLSSIFPIKSFSVSDSCKRLFA